MHHPVDLRGEPTGHTFVVWLLVFVVQTLFKVHTSILPLVPAMSASLCNMTPRLELICATRLLEKYRVAATQ